MGRLAFFCGIGLRIICRVQSGRAYWRGRVWQSSRSGESCGKSQQSGSELDHRSDPPKSARYALAIDHNGARIKAHLRGAFGPDSFVLTVGE